MSIYTIENYKNNCRVIVVKITSSDQILKAGNDSIHKIIESNNLSNAVGIYFYRFKDISTFKAFSKIGEVSRKEGIIERKYRGWLAPDTYGDSYRKLGKKTGRKVIYSDVLSITENNPMYFTFYEFDVDNAFPKIDEILAFKNHKDFFGHKPRNKEQANTFVELGSKLVWYKNAFNEVNTLKLPSGTAYP